VPSRTAALGTAVHHVPIRVRWADWETTTLTLKHCGWEVLAEERMADHAFAMAYRVACVEPERRMVLTGCFTVSYECVGFGDGIAEMIYHRGVELVGYQATDRIVQYQMSPAEVVSLDRLQPFDGMALCPVRALRVVRPADPPALQVRHPLVVGHAH
jgi:hypothetical protein